MTDVFEFEADDIDRYWAELALEIGWPEDTIAALRASALALGATPDFVHVDVIRMTAPSGAMFTTIREAGTARGLAAAHAALTAAGLKADVDPNTIQSSAFIQQSRTEMATELEVAAQREYNLAVQATDEKTSAQHIESALGIYRVLDHVAGDGKNRVAAVTKAWESRTALGGS